MSPLDWDKARRDSQRARERVAAQEFKASGQRSPIKRGAKPITDKQRAYIKTLQSSTGTHEPMPPTAWQASNLIDHLRKTQEGRRRAAQ